ncbi:MAG: hypothetical protein WDA75_18885 [Candidatus Latescibacterota bacterium]|jgi:galactokinase/mevalonate kinase-like predicted kinase
MRALLDRLAQARDLPEVTPLLDDLVSAARAGQGSLDDRRLLLRRLVLHPELARASGTAAAVDHLLAALPVPEWTERFGDAVEKELPGLLVDLVDGLWDVDHRELLRLMPAGAFKPIFASLKALSAYPEKLQGSARCLRGMRVARILTDLYRTAAEDEKAWRRRTPPACCIDNDRIVALKEGRQIRELPEAYEARVNQLQRIDLRRSLTALDERPAEAPVMHPEDYERGFAVLAPLRLGISSANASDNHMRSKERGAVTLNAGIALQMDGEDRCAPPLKVTARRLTEPKLTLRSLSMDFRAEFEASDRGDAAAQSELFFAYRRGGDEALRLAKQALVHVGVVRDNSTDVIADVTAFTGGGGLELTTESKVLQGSGLGTSSILAAAILKTLYRLSRNPWGEAAQEYPALYDQSLLLEQSIGLNSGWQDARGAGGGPSAVKNFIAPPTEGLPAPERTFLTEVDEGTFTERVVLFDTGIARAATRGLNVVLDVYLSRDSARYPAIGESMRIHDEMVAALRAGDYPALGGLATRYWKLRCTLDPGATNDTLQHLFDGPELREVSEGGLITGAGGGGFALLIARAGAGEELRARLGRLRQDPAWSRCGVVGYRLDRLGIRLADSAD